MSLSILSIPLLVLASILSYCNSFSVPFQLDDVTVIEHNSLLKSIDRWQEIFRFDPTRFLTHSSFALNYYFSGFDVRSFHAVNWIVHTLNGILVFFLIERILRVLQPKITLVQYNKTFPPTEWGAYLNSFSFFQLIPWGTALIFLVHPLQTESVTYIVQRSVLLAAFFYLAALLLYLMLKEKFSSGRYALVWICTLLGSMCKPTIVSLPLMIVVFEFFLFSSNIKNLFKKWWILLPFILPAGIVPVFLMMFNLNQPSATTAVSPWVYATAATSEISRDIYFLTQLSVLIKYVGLLFWPVGLTVDYHYPLATGWTDVRSLLSAVGLLGLIMLAFLSFKAHRVISFCIIWFFVMLFVESSVFPLQDVIFEHRLYLAVIGFGLGLCYILSRLIKRVWLCFAVFVVFACSLMILTYSRNMIWNYPLVLIEEALKKSVDSPRLYKQRGYWLEKEGLLSKAVEAYGQAIRLDPAYLTARHRLGQLFLNQGQWSIAEKIYRQILEISSEDYLAHLNLGKLLLYQGQKELSRGFLYKAASIRPNTEQTFLALGEYQLSLNKDQEARILFEKALRINPLSAAVHYQLGNLDLKNNNYQEAQAFYLRAIDLLPSYSDAYNALGVVFVNLNQKTEAAIAFKKSIQFNPKNIVGMYNLVKLYESLGHTLEAQRLKERIKELNSSFKR